VRKSVKTTMMDMEFDELKSLMLHMASNTTLAQEHVGEIKCKIRVIKERARGTINMLPYHKMPKLMVIELTSHLQEAIINVLINKATQITALSWIPSKGNRRMILPRATIRSFMIS